jgi:hypothetical protein
MPKITSADCVKTLIDFFKISGNSDQRNYVLGSWKRASKKGNVKEGFVRIFENKINGTVVRVESTEDMIMGVSVVSVSAPVTTPVTPPERGLLKFLRNIRDTKGRTYDESPCLSLGDLPLDKYPRTKSADPDGDGLEEVCFENEDVMYLDDTVIKIVAGGDWQDPIAFTVSLVNGVLHYNDDGVVMQEHNNLEGWWGEGPWGGNGLSNAEINALLDSEQGGLS